MGFYLLVQILSSAADFSTNQLRLVSEGKIKQRRRQRDTYRVPSIDASARSAYYGTNIRGFVTDLSRVVQEKHSALRQPLPPPQQQQQSTNTVRMAAPQPPPPRRPGTEPAFVPEDLPPPPAELLEELNTLRRKHSRQPPPPPKRQLAQVTSS